MISQCVGTKTPAAGARPIAQRSTGAKKFLGGNALKVAMPKAAGARKIVAMSAQNDLVGGNYAIALVDLAQESGNLEAVHADIDGLASVLSEDASLCEFLMNPVVKDDKKKQVLDSLCKEAEFSDTTFNFLCLIVDKGRIDCIVEICEAFETKYCELTDTQVATLKSAVKLEQEQQFLIAKKLQELTGSKNIKLKPVIDPSLLAGFIVEYGSSQIDLSVKGQVDKIEEELRVAAGV